jgi:hypothetical protein
MHVLRRLQFLYRGSLPPLMTAGVVQSLNFSGKIFKKVLYMVTLFCKYSRALTFEKFIIIY